MTIPADQAKIQDAVEKFWNAKPCDSDTSEKDLYSAEYFRDIERQRYKLQPHTLELLDSLDLRGKRVLEIGTGVGTDARTIIGRGGNYTGINVDAGSCNATHRALEKFGLKSEVRQASALEIPFGAQEFDLVYSFGVLHHIAAVEKAIKEIRRVLRPDGLLVIMLYNKNSINYHLEIRHLRKWGLWTIGLPGVLQIIRRLGLPEEKLQRHLELRKSLGSVSDAEWLSRNTDGPDNPYSRVYDHDEAEELLAGFRQIRQQVRFFDYRHWGLLGRLAPLSLRRRLGDRWGWHRIVVACHPDSLV